MEDRIFFAGLAGLFHDVGKIEQRASDTPWKAPEGVEAEGQPIHAAYSAGFIQTYIPEPYRKALHGAYHHRPERSPAEDKRMGMLVALADKLSAGERADLDEEKQRFPQQMVSIFDRLFANGEAPTHYLPLRPLSLTQEAIFARADAVSKNPKADYTTLRDLLREATRRDEADKESYLEGSLSAFQQATWCVPSAYYHSIPDVSLYDHSRMTGALAVCLSELTTEELSTRLGAVERAFHGKPEAGDAAVLAEPAALLIGGDLSGIQEFIYTITARHAAKTLRGRSFFLQLLTEALLRFVLRQLGLPYLNVIYAGGGHFYLLAPASAREKLEAIRQQVSSTLLDAFGSSLYLAIGAAEVPYSGFRLGQFQKHWGEMHAQLSQAKLQRYAELGDALYPKVFAPQTHGGNQDKTCGVCGTEDEHVKTAGSQEEGEGSYQICPLCESFDVEIGKKLPGAAFAVLGLGEPQPLKERSAKGLLRAFGLDLHLISAREAAGNLAGWVERTVVWALDDPKDWPDVKTPTAKWLHYGLNRVPEMTFDEMQKMAVGIQRLGVLRMDVDNLGKAFSEGFGKGEGSATSLARTSALSLQISLFFDGWVKRICEDEERFGPVYAVYAGGDDLFLLARWDKTPALAREVSRSFQVYTNGRGRLHLSGGMSFLHGKYPIYQAAEDAAEALALAKAHPGKNAFHFLGDTWGWDTFDQLEEKMKRLAGLEDGKEKGESASALLQLLQQLDRQKQSTSPSVPGGKVIFGPWMWMAAYHLARRIEKARGDDKEREKLETIQKDLEQGQFATLHQWGKAARWAQLWLRERK